MLMKLDDIQKKREKIQRKLAILDSIKIVEKSDDFKLLKEMKDQFTSEIRMLDESEAKIIKLNKIRNLVLPKIVLIFSLPIVIIMFILGLSGKSTFILQNPVFISFLYIVIIVLVCMDLSIIYSFKRKLILIIAFAFVIICNVIKVITGYNPLQFIDELHITFFFSLFSFLNTLLDERKRKDKV